MFAHVSWLLGTFFGRLVRRLIHSMMGSACRKVKMEMFDQVVGKVDDLPDNSMKEVKLSDSGPNVLLVKCNGQVKALSPKCTHYGAPLSKGSLCPEKGIVRCPWHGACFNVETGDIEDFPGLDSLNSYEVQIEGDDIRVKGTRKKIKSTLKSQSEERVVIVGGGATAQVCAETLRNRSQNPWRGEIVIVSKENDLPYDRPKLSKVLTASGKDLQLRPREFYDEAGIRTLLGGKNRVEI